MSILSSIGFTGGGGILGGSLVKGVQLLWKDKKKIEAQYRIDRHLFFETVKEVKAGYDTLSADIAKIMAKLGIE